MRGAGCSRRRRRHHHRRRRQLAPASAGCRTFPHRQGYAGWGTRTCSRASSTGRARRLPPTVDAGIWKESAVIRILRRRHRWRRLRHHRRLHRRRARRHLAIAIITGLCLPPSNGATAEQAPPSCASLLRSPPSPYLARRSTRQLHAPLFRATLQPRPVPPSAAPPYLTASGSTIEEVGSPCRTAERSLDRLHPSERLTRRRPPFRQPRREL